MLSVHGNQDDPKRRFNRSMDHPVGARDLKLEPIDVDKAVKSTAVPAAAPGPIAHGFRPANIVRGGRRARHIAAAAAVQGCVASAISQRIAKLETDLMRILSTGGWWRCDAH